MLNQMSEPETVKLHCAIYGICLILIISLDIYRQASYLSLDNLGYPQAHHPSASRHEDVLRLASPLTRGD